MQGCEEKSTGVARKPSGADCSPELLSLQGEDQQIQLCPESPPTAAPVCIIHCKQKPETPVCRVRENSGPPVKSASASIRLKLHHPATTPKNYPQKQKTGFSEAVQESKERGPSTGLQRKLMPSLAAGVAEPQNQKRLPVG
ncbi:hypothetical protein H920_10522 [Fukomys damarensis]|uniref:Uncharacterized protein n=1 Tax=Fukomys damarensis TaxID=885580 RepID=A0A091DCD2_FUKDA|nr:hypothetical protein H920_10522 [Fukomys damarensis]